MADKQNKMNQTDTNSNKTSLKTQQSSNPLDQFSDVVYQTVDNMVEDNNQETEQQG